MTCNLCKHPTSHEPWCNYEFPINDRPAMKFTPDNVLAFLIESGDYYGAGLIADKFSL